MQHVIVCAAIRNKRGIIICGVRHFDKLMVDQIQKSTSSWMPKHIEQGFVDNKGNFLNKTEALIVARLANQVVRRVGGDKVELYSENLY